MVNKPFLYVLKTNHTGSHRLEQNDSVIVLYGIFLVEEKLNFGRRVFLLINFVSILVTRSIVGGGELISM